MFLVNQTLNSWIIFVAEQNFWKLSGMLICWKATNQVMSSHSSLLCWVMLSQVNEVNFHLWITANFQVRMNIEQTKQDFIMCLYHNSHPFTHWLNRRKHKLNIWQNELASNQTIKQTNKQVDKQKETTYTKQKTGNKIRHHHETMWGEVTWVISKKATTTTTQPNDSDGQRIVYIFIL